MPTPPTLLLRPFLPAKDYALSKAFYTTLGFTQPWEGHNMAEFQLDAHHFFLQNAYVKEWAENYMLNLVVPDVHAWHAHIQSTRLLEKFPTTKATTPQPRPEGLILYLHDPAGVLWHIQQRPTP